MSVLLRKKFPKFYKIYQETIGDLFYELICAGTFARVISKRRLRKLEINPMSPIEITYFYEGVGIYKTIRPFQIKTEIRKLYDIVQERKPGSMCEIGSDLGGTLYLWSKAINSHGLAISIDLPRLYRKSLNRFFSNFFTDTQEIQFIRHNSHSPDCLKKFEKILGGKQ